MRDTEPLDLPLQTEDVLPPVNDDAVNILRQRTFNEELRGLVNRVTRHRDIPETAAETGLDTGPNEILRNLHRLYYRARNIQWRPAGDRTDISLEFSGSGEFNRTMATEAIDSALRRHGCEGFALLNYDFAMKAYRPMVNTIRKAEESALFIGLHDPVVPLIYGSPGGIIISDTAGHDSNGEWQRFAAIVGEKPGFTVYVSGTSAVFDKFSGEGPSAEPEDQALEYPYPLFITICPEEVRAGDIYSCIRTETALPLYMLCSGFSSTVSLSSDDSSSLALEKIEFIYRVAANCGFDRCFNVGIRGEIGQEAGYRLMLSFLFGRIRRQFGSVALLIRFKTDYFTVLIRRDSQKTLEELVDEASNLCEGVFYLDPVSPGTAGSIHSIMMRTVI